MANKKSSSPKNKSATMSAVVALTLGHTALVELIVPIKVFESMNVPGEFLANTSAYTLLIGMVRGMGRCYGPYFEQILGAIVEIMQKMVKHEKLDENELPAIKVLEKIIQQTLHHLEQGDYEEWTNTILDNPTDHDSTSESTNPT